MTVSLVPRFVPTPAAAPKRVTWVELFFDLVYAFVVTQVAMVLHGDHTPLGVFRALVVFVPVYWAWVGTSVYADTHAVHALIDRLGLFLVGLSSLYMAMAMPGAYGDRGALLGSAYLGARLVLAALALRGPFRQVPLNPYTIAVCVSGPLMLAGGLLDGRPRLVCWTIAAASDLLAPRLVRRQLARIPFDAAHLAERFGLFFIIALGESVIVVGLIASTLPITPLRLFAVAAAYGLAFALWWAYFHLSAQAIRRAMERAPVRTEFMRPVLTYGHLVYIGSLVAISVGLAKVVGTPTANLPLDEIWLLNLGTALYLATFTYTRWRIFHRFPATGFAGAIACLILVPIGMVVPAVVLTLLLTAVIVAISVLEARRPSADQPPDVGR